MLVGRRRSIVACNGCDCRHLSDASISILVDPTRPVDYGSKHVIDMSPKETKMWLDVCLRVG